MADENEFQDGQQVLSQSEVERLLAQVAESQNSVTVHKGASEVQQASKEAIQPYDFRNPVFLSSIELRRLRLRHEEFIRALAARLSIYLRLDFGLQMSKLQTITFQKFTESLSNPTQIVQFKVEPLRGVCLLEINPRLALTIVDRLMGGPAHSVSADHDFSEIEIALMNQTVQVILGEWCAHWVKIQELRPTLLGHETNGRFLQTAAHDTVMLTLAMEARIGDCMEQMQIAFPYHTLEPLIRHLSQSPEEGGPSSQKSSPVKPRWNREFEEVRVPVIAEWRGLEMTVGDLSRLRVGDILQLDPACAGQVTIRFANMPKYTARLGTRNQKWAVELATPLKSDPT
jgi:flagellar motor switch protein FliM